MPKSLLVSLLVAALCALSADGLTQQPPTLGHWPQWRGPNRDNVCAETGLLEEWPEGGPPLVWRVKGLGGGIAPVSVAGGRIFTVGQVGEVEYLIALEEGTGRHLWTVPLGRAIRQNPLMRWLSQRAPTIDGDRVYVLTAEGELVCLAVADGTERWRRNYVKDFEGERGWWGFCDYPLVDGEKLVCTPGGAKATIVALQKRTGGLLWRSATSEDDGPGYAATVLSHAGGVRQYIVFLHKGLVGVAADDGRLLWHYGKLVSEQNALTPLVRGDEVFCASGRNPIGVALLELTTHGDDRFTVNERYFQPPRPNHFQDSLVAVGNHVYGTSWNGPFCIAWNTGKTLWSEPISRSGPRRRSPMTAILYADGRLYLRQSDGTVKLIEANPKEYRERGRLEIPEHEPSIGATFPVIAAGRLYLRDNDNLFCYDVRGDALETPRGDALTIALPKSEPRSAGHWPQWRGPNRDNCSTDTGLLKQWPEAGPPLLWRVEGLPEGIASVSVAGGRIYTIGYQHDSEFCIALNEKDGRFVWATRIGASVRENPLMRWLTQRSPTIDGDRLYVISAQGDLFCLSASDGKELWRKSYPKDFGAGRRPWGFCDHPLVDGEQLFCQPGSATAAVASLNKMTGEVIWQTAVPEERMGGYSPAVVSEGGGVRQYVVFLGPSLVGVAAEDGRLLWRYLKNSARLANTYTPIVQGDLVLSPGDYRSGIALLELAAEGNGVGAKERYTLETRLDRFQDGTVVVGDHLYAFRGGQGIPMCFAWKTGETVWGPLRTRGRGRVALTYADGRLYMRYSDGQVILVEAGAEEYIEHGNFQIPDHEPSAGSTLPVVTGARLYLRDNNRLFCYDVREAPEPGRQPPTTVVLAIRAPQGDAAAADSGRRPDAVFVPTPNDVVGAMLKAAGVEKEEVVFDLGSGDGRIVIAAARDFGCNAVGYEIDEALVKLSRQRVRESKVEELVRIEQQDLFKADLSGADVVAVYLPPELLKRLMPQFAKLKPGARIVSHQFRIPGIEPDETTSMVSDEDGEEHTIYLWTAPLKGNESGDVR